MIIDFEGEPARPLPERRQKRSPLRDVAGMLRSFAYATSAVELQRGRDGARRTSRQRAREAFLERLPRATVDPALLPAGEAAIASLLSIFELEKALYELRYELDNRPDWVPIPVAGIAAAAGARRRRERRVGRSSRARRGSSDREHARPARRARRPSRQAAAS